MIIYMTNLEHRVLFSIHYEMALTRESDCCFFAFVAWTYQASSSKCNTELRNLVSSVECMEMKTLVNLKC